MEELCKKYRSRAVFLVLLALVFLALGIFFFNKGFDVKNNYESGESLYFTAVNAYVGGDAYNLIINGNYFTGYMVVACFSIFAALFSLATSFYFSLNGNHLSIKYPALSAPIEEVDRIDTIPNN